MNYCDSWSVQNNSAEQMRDILAEEARCDGDVVPPQIWFRPSMILSRAHFGYPVFAQPDSASS
jgi:hypothetical protein